MTINPTLCQRLVFAGMQCDKFVTGVMGHLSRGDTKAPQGPRSGSYNTYTSTPQPNQHRTLLTLSIP